MNVYIERVRLRRRFDAAGRFSRFRVEDHGENRDSMLIIFASPAHVANPGWEVWRGDKFLSQPCEIGDVAKVHDACRAFIARKSPGVLVGVIFVHLTASGAGCS